MGRLVADPELKMTTNGTPVTQVRIAVDRPHKKDVVDYINVVVWRQSAEFLCKYGRKGNMVALNGCLTSRNYEDKNGSKRTAFEVVADSVKLCSYSQSGGSDASFTAPQEPYTVVDDGDEDLPF